MIQSGSAPTQWKHLSQLAPGCWHQPINPSMFLTWQPQFGRWEEGEEEEQRERSWRSCMHRLPAQLWTSQPDPGRHYPSVQVPIGLYRWTQSVGYKLTFFTAWSRLFNKVWSDTRNLKNADLMGGKADAVIHVRLGDKEMKTKVRKKVSLKTPCLKCRIQSCWFVQEEQNIWKYLANICLRLWKRTTTRKYKRLSGSNIPQPQNNLSCFRFMTIVMMIVYDQNNLPLRYIQRYIHTVFNIKFDFKVYDWDRFSKNDLMGEVKTTLQSLKWKIESGK